MRTQFLILALSLLVLGVPVWAGSSGGASGGGTGVASSVGGSATLPATCAEKDLYQDTDSGGTEFYVCTATNTWTKTGTGSGDVVGPASATADKFPLFSGTTGKLIKNNSDYGISSGYMIGSGAVSGYLNSLSGAFGGMVIGGTGADVSYLSFYTNGTAGIVGLEYRAVNDYRLGLKATTGICWVSTGVANDTENCDSGFVRIAPGIVGASDGTPTGMGWLYQDGIKALNADFTSTSATPANLTGLTVTLKTGRKYTFRMALRFADSTAADGARFDFDGGTATATDFGVNCKVFDTGFLLAQDATALATDFAPTTTTGASSIECNGSFTVNAAGTFIPRAGQEAASGGTLTVETGSFLHVTDTSFN